MFKETTKGSMRNTPIILLITLFTLISTAWIADDSAITLRTAYNFLNGYGLVFNIGERVQAYTHPMWFFLITISSIITRNILVTAYVLPIITTLTTIWIYVRYISHENTLTNIGITSLLLSKAFLDYSTSGLENPLSHLLLATMIALTVKEKKASNKKNLEQLSFLASTIYLTRADLLLLAAPAIFVDLLDDRRPLKHKLKIISFGMIPAIAWSLFSLYYYGFLLPNTAYAKLGTGISTNELIQQGLFYLIDSAGRDPITLGCIAWALATSYKSKGAIKALGAGVLIYIVYLIIIGGDFMSGRFLTAPYFVSICILTIIHSEHRNTSQSWMLVPALGIIGLYNRTILPTDTSMKTILKTGITDERQFHVEKTGLLNVGRSFFKLPQPGITARDVEIICGGIGFKGLKAGPYLHLIDYCGLTEPLLARIPAKHDDSWRAGHFGRQIPENYEETIRTGVDVLADPATKGLYESLRTITQQPLNSGDRIKEILKINLTKPKADFETYKSGAIQVNSNTPALKESLLKIPNESSLKNQHQFTTDIDIVLDSTKLIKSLQVKLQNDDTYKVSMFFNGKLIPLTVFGPLPDSGEPYISYTYEAPPELTIPTDRIRIRGSNGDGRYGISFIEIASQM